MSQLTRWDPFHELEQMHNRLSSLFSRGPLRGEGNESLSSADWVPVVDITEDDHAYVIKAELPEVRKEDVKVTVENGVLTISGERRFEKEEKGRRYHRVERSYGSFARSFNLPEDADAAKVTATHKDGVLSVSLAKSEAAKPRQVQVKIS